MLMEHVTSPYGIKSDRRGKWRSFPIMNIEQSYQLPTAMLPFSRDPLYLDVFLYQGSHGFRFLKNKNKYVVNVIAFLWLAWTSSFRNGALERV